MNWHEEGADDVAELLSDRGIAVEAGLWHSDALDRWRSSPHRSRCLRVLVELSGGIEPAAVAGVARRLVDGVTRTEPDIPVLLHGYEMSAWPVLEVAARWRLDTRIGLEDTLLLPSGERAVDNAALVAAGLERIRAN